MKQFILRVTAVALIATHASPVLAADYKTTLAQARSYYAGGNYAAAYNLLRSYRAGNAGTLQVDDLLGISACAIASLRTNGLALLRRLPIDYAPLTSTNANLVNQQISACSRMGSGTPPRIAMLPAGGGSTSFPIINMEAQRSEALRRAITEMPLAVPKVQVTPGLAP